MKGITAKKIICFTLVLIFLCVALFSVLGCDCASLDKKNGDSAIVIDPNGEGPKKEPNYKISEKRTVNKVVKLTLSEIGGEDVMPLGGFWGPFDKDPNAPQLDIIDGVEVPNFLTDKYFTLLKEAGVNLFWATGVYWGQSGVVETLDMAKKYGMGCIVLDSQITGWGSSETVNNITKAQVNATIKEYINHPACAGVYVYDEPWIRQYAAIGEFSDIFYNQCDIGDKIIATTLAGHDGYRESGYEWQQEITKFIDDTHAKYVCIDDYTWDEGKSVGGKSHTLRLLSKAREVLNQKEVPMFNMIQAGGQWTLESYDEADPWPTEGQFMWNFNTALAFGSKGMLMFPLVQPYTFIQKGNSASDFTRQGLFGADGRINRWYYYLKKANSYMRAIQTILLNSTCEATILSGDAMLDSTDVKGIETSYQQLKEVSGNANIGCFNHGGKTMLYVVNHSTENKEKIKLTFDDTYKCDVYQRATHLLVYGKEFSLTLEAGEGALVELY